jgi:beta-mannosidase
MFPPVASARATVPGAVQADLMAAGLLADINVGLNSNDAEWVSNREWVYERSFTLPEGYQKHLLCFDGLDYHGEIHLNGRMLQTFSGMFLPVEIDITGIAQAGENNLRVIFYQPPEVEGQIGYSNRVRQFKSRFNYVWDWCPRIVPVGIWEDVYLKSMSVRGLSTSARGRRRGTAASQRCWSLRRTARESITPR